MKNIYVLSTTNPSRLYLGDNGNFVFGIIQTSIQSRNDDFTNQNIYITSDEEPKAGDYSIATISGNLEVVQLNQSTCIYYDYKIILTTDQDLIKDGVQPINDEFLEWFVKNPSCEEVEVENIPNNSWGFDLEEPMNLGYKIIIPKEEPKQETFNSKRGLKELQLKDPNTCENYKEVGCVKDVCDCYTLVAKPETLEEAGEKEAEGRYPVLTHSNPKKSPYVGIKQTFKHGVRFGAKWQIEQEQDKNKYSEEEVEPLLSFIRDIKDNWDCDNDAHKYGTICRCCDAEKTLEQFKKK